MGSKIGIDLGTTNSAVAHVDFDGKPEIIINSDGEYTTPSVVAFDEESILVGKAALAQAAVNPADTIMAIKRHMAEPGFTVKTSSGSYTPQEISALILKKLKREAEEALGDEIEEAVITAPAYFSTAQRAATREAGEIAGLNVKRILDEPAAAALAYKLDDEDRINLCVFDFGGGTLDISVLRVARGRFSVLSTSGDNELGGKDFDDIMLRLLCQRFQQQTGVNLLGAGAVALERVRTAAEDAKKSLSFRDKVRVSVPFVVPEKALSMDITVTRPDFEKAAWPLFERMAGPLKEALAYSKLQPADIDEVLFSGGTTRMPKVREIVGEIFNKQPLAKIDPDQCVALGAAFAAAEGATKVTFKVSRSLGVEVAGGEFSPLLSRGSTLPTSAVNSYTTSFDKQTVISFPIYQGDSARAEKNVLLGEMVIDGIQPAPAGEARVSVTFEMGTEGLLKAIARDVRTGQAMSVELEGTIMSETERQAAIERIDTLASKIE